MQAGAIVQGRIAFRIAGTALLLYLAFFALLSADALVRLWIIRRSMDRALDGALVLLYQAAQVATTLLGVLLAARLLRRAASPDARALTLLLIFAALAHAKAFAFAAFPGPLQSWIASSLFAAGFPRCAARLIFGEPSWAVWLALGALLRVAATFPHAMRPDQILASGANDRQGMLRSVALAGVDVGAFWRRVAAFIVRAGLLRGAFVWPFAFAAGITPLLAPVPGGRAASLVLFAAGVSIAITLLRAGRRSASRVDQRRLLWMTQAAISALVSFLIVGVLALSNDPLADGLAFAITGAAPLAVLFGVALATRVPAPPPAFPAIHRTLLAGAVALASSLAYTATGAVVSSVAGPGPTAVIGATAAVAAGLLLLRPIADRLDATVAGPPD